MKYIKYIFAILIFGAIIFKLPNNIHAAGEATISTTVFNTYMNSGSMTKEVTLTTTEEILQNGISWTSSNNNIATVEKTTSTATTETVTITAKNPGNAIITASITGSDSKVRKYKHYVTIFSEENYNKIINKQIELTYGLFGAKGDGKTDDFETIRATHEFANQIYSSKKINLTVCGEENKTYYIGAGSIGTAINVNTNTNWKNCNFIIDDYVDADGDKINDVTTGNPIFVVASSRSILKKTLKQIKEVQTDYEEADFYINESITNAEWLADYLSTQRIGSYGYKNLYVTIINKNKAGYRSGISRYNIIENFIIDMQEENFGMILNEIANDIISSSDFEDDKSENIQINIFPMDEDKITIQNGKFLTYTNNEVYNESGQENDYIKRGIQIYRSNVIINNIVHTINEEKHLNNNGMQNLSNGNLYYGFLYSYSASNLIIKNCKLMPHTYVTKNSTSIGTYDLVLDRSINVTLDNVTYSCICTNKQTNEDSTTYCENCYERNIIDDTKWGIMISNCLKNIDIHNSKLNRVDSHQGVWELTVKDSIIGVKAFTLIGGGNCLIENVTLDGGSQIVTLRKDYGANWKGAITLKNVIWKVKENENDPRIILAINPGNLNYGQECYFPDLKIYNLTIDNSRNSGKNTRIFILNLEEPTSVTYPYGFYGNIDLKNIKNLENENSNFYLWLAKLDSTYSRFKKGNYRNTSQIKLKIQNIHNFGYNSIEDKEEESVEKYNNIKNTIFNVEKMQLGDMDNDKQITAYDAYKTLEYSVRENIEDEILYLLDMDEDETITAYDAYKILKSSIGL